MSRLRALVLAIAAIAVALTAIAVPAQAAKRAKAAKPKITRVTPMRLTVGEVLTIRGKVFKAKARRNTVVFQGAGGRTAFAKPRSATRRKLVVRVPASVARLLIVRDSRQLPTRVKLRVLAGRFSDYTPRRLSPVIVSSTDAGPGGGTPVVCDSDSDHDDDLLANSDEVAYGTDPCLADTDRDGMVDGWELFAAKDLNTKAVPYPAKRPYPNPLDPSDANVDFDGDFIPAKVEFALWRHTGSAFDAGRLGPVAGSPLGYSDGTQRSRPEGDPGVPAFRSPGYALTYAFLPPAYPARHEMHADGAWTDDERDADVDGLNNFVETAGPGHAKWWAAWLAKEAVPKWPESYFGEFTRRPFADLDPADPDIDGDTLLDGEDDQDDDDVLNFDEMYDPEVLYGPDSRRKNAFNPCAPDTGSRTCPIYVPL